MKLKFILQEINIVTPFCKNTRSIYSYLVNSKEHSIGIGFGSVTYSDFLRKHKAALKERPLKIPVPYQLKKL